MVDKTIGRNINVTDTAFLSESITLNSSTSTTIQAINTTRMHIIIFNSSNSPVWIKLQAASVDNDKKGFQLLAKGSWSMPVDNIYTGEISAIAANNNADIYVTRY